MIMGYFVEVYQRRGLKVNADKRKVMMLGGEEELQCEVRMDRMPLKEIFVLCFGRIG